MQVFKRITDMFDSDASLLYSEVISKIPKEKLVPAICEFYWNKGHKTIKIIRKKPTDHENYAKYDPLKKIEDVSEITEISVATFNKKENRQVFDSVNVNFDKDRTFETKMHWYIGYGYRDWQMIYFLVAVLAGFYYIHHFGVPADTWIKYKATLVSIAWALPVYLLAKRRPKKFERHPSIEQYKTDFEGFIRKKEKELLSERY